MKVTKEIRRNPTLRWTSGLLGVAFLLGGLTWAAANKAQIAKSDLAISLVARKVVVQADGKEQLLPAERAYPGEIIQYDAHYVNQSGDSLGRVSPVIPIPNGMVYLPNSANPPPAEASLDGRTFAPIPLRRTVVTPSGERRVEEVPPTEYRALRWRLGALTAGGQATVTARTKLIPAGR